MAVDDNIVDLSHRKRGSPRSAKASAKEPQTELGERLLTQDSAAIDFVRLHGNRLRYDEDAGAWFEWDGHRWRQARKDLAFHLAREMVRDLVAREPDRVRYMSAKTSFASSVERYARTDPAIAIKSESWDRDIYLLGTPGGTVDLRTGELRPGRPEDCITKSAAVAPAEAAICPLWIKFLDETTGGDVELIRFLRQWFGLSLSGDISEQALAFFFGQGGNGKGVFANTLTGILGDYAMVAAIDSLTEAKGDRHSADLAMLRGARAVIASETEEGRAWAEGRIKSLTGGDPITAHFMHRDYFTYVPQFKLTICGNPKPVLRTVNDAVRRRFRLIPFTRKPATPDKQLAEKLKDEWPGILRWAIDGFRDWLEHRLISPATISEATATYLADQDIFTQWIEDACDLEPGNRFKSATSAALYASWTAYATAAGEKPGSRKTFGEAIERLDVVRTKDRAGIRGYFGIRIKPEGADQ